MTNTRVLPQAKLNRHSYFKIPFTNQDNFECIFLCENFDALDFTICSKKKIMIIILYVTTELILLYKMEPGLLKWYQ